LHKNKYSFAADYLEIIKTIKEGSEVLAYDEENETVRLKEGATLVRFLKYLLLYSFMSICVGRVYVKAQAPPAVPRY
jgi:hypothetical protein